MENTFTDQELYKISLALLKDLHKEGELTEREMNNTSAELKKIYNINPEDRFSKLRY